MLCHRYKKNIYEQEEKQSGKSQGQRNLSLTKSFKPPPVHPLSLHRSHWYTESFTTHLLISSIFAPTSAPRPVSLLCLYIIWLPLHVLYQLWVSSSVFCFLFPLFCLLFHLLLPRSSFHLTLTSFIFPPTSSPFFHLLPSTSPSPSKTDSHLSLFISVFLLQLSEAALGGESSRARSQQDLALSRKHGGRKREPSRRRSRPSVIASCGPIRSLSYQRLQATNHCKGVLTRKTTVEPVLVKKKNQNKTNRLVVFVLPSGLTLQRTLHRLELELLLAMKG